MARRESLVVRHPTPKLSDDWFMLDRWTPAAAHTLTVRYRDVFKNGVAVERVYRSFCPCGWRSAEFHKPTRDVCPVGEALHQRSLRVARSDRPAAILAHDVGHQGDRIIWHDHVEEPT